MPRAVISLWPGKDSASSLVYMTAKTGREALELARILAGRKLCAGINIVPGATSVYWWDGEIREKMKNACCSPR